jgi:hypothetical protein
MKLSGNQALYPPLPIALGPGQVYVLPAGQGIVSTFGSGTQGFTGFTLTGQYLVNLGPYTNLQMFDSVLQTWRNIAMPNAIVPISCDGTNFRLANTTGAAVGAIVQTAGTGLTNGFNTVTATVSAGGSSWNTIVGGAINPTLQIASGGTGYTQRPIVVFNPPANQGSTPYILPQAVTSITAGLISAVTVTQVGAGLIAQPTVTVIPAPGDTTGGGGSLACTAALTGSGTLTALYTTGNYGTIGLTAAPTFTFSPASTITASAIMNFTITSVSVVAAGAAYGNAQPVGITTFGQQTSTTRALLTGNSYFDTSIVLPRNASIQATSTAGGAVGTAANLLAATIHDAGFGFQAAPNLFVIPGGTAVAVTTQAQLTAIVGGQNDISVLQSL